MDMRDEYIKKETLISIFNAKADMALGSPKHFFLSMAEMVRKLPAADVIVPRVRMEQKVYIPDEFGRIKAVIESISVDRRGLCYEWCKYDYGVDETEVWDYGTFRDDDIGKTVFLSFEDFERALAEREGEG